MAEFTCVTYLSALLITRKVFLYFWSIFFPFSKVYVSKTWPKKKLIKKALLSRKFKNGWVYHKLLLLYESVSEEGKFSLDHYEVQKK